MSIAKQKSRGQVLIHSDEEYLVVTRKICIFALYNVKKHLSCDVWAGIKLAL